MIIRTWRGRAAASNPDAYIEHFRRKVRPELQKIDGFLGAMLLEETRADAVEFFLLTKWASMDAIRAFAGDDVERAVVYPEVEAALLCFDRTVRHYEVVEEVSTCSNHATREATAISNGFRQPSAHNGRDSAKTPCRSEVELPRCPCAGFERAQ